jgi:beta-glucanase (GH16 family)
MRMLRLVLPVVVTCVAMAAPVSAQLSLNRPASASSVEATGFEAGKAVDGNSSTRWSSVFADNQWLAVDLGSTKSLDRVVLRWEAAYGRSYKIQVSNDGTTWTDAYSTTAGDGGVDDIPLSASGRHVRMLGLLRGSAYGFSLFEMEVYGATPTPTPTPGTTYVEVTPAAAGVTASADDGNVPGNSVDNLLATRWSANGDGQWIRFDLGSVRTVGYVKVAVYNGNLRQARFDLQLSSDGSNWSNAITGATSSGTTTQEQTFDFADASARYVRYLGHGNTVNLWNSLNEVSVFAVTGMPTATPTPRPTPIPTATPGPTPTPTPIWSDEFDGPTGTPIDSLKWKHDVGGGGWGNNQLEYDTNRTTNASLDGAGHLVITARRETYTGTDGVTRNYTSARINTAGKFEQAYGRFEARMRLPAGKGMWPAFWMLGNNVGGGWPACGEIDIMENVGHEPSVNHGSLHGPGYSGGSPLTATYTLPNGQRFTDGYHTFRIDWEPGAVRFYVDGILYQTRTPASMPAGGTWVYDHPFFIILNVAVGGNWPGSPDGTTVFPQQLLVDYVRVYNLP